MLGINKIWGRSRGFTLVEIMTVVLITTILSGVIFTILLVGLDSWQINSLRIQLEAELRKAALLMSNDLRQSGSFAIIDVPPDGTLYNTITFRIAAGVSNGILVWSADTIQFLRAGASGNQLERLSAGTLKIIANDIVLLQFSRQPATPDILKVSVSASKPTPKRRELTLILDFQVQLRN